VEGRLTEEWRKEHPQAEDGQILLDRILRERRERWEKDQIAQFKKKGKEPPKHWQSKYEEPSSPDTSELPELPEEWVFVGLGVSCDKIQDGTHFSPSQESQKPSGTFPYVTAKNVRPWGMDLESLTFLEEADHRPIYERCDTRKGDVLLVKDGVNAGDACLNTIDGEASLLSSVCMIRPHRDLLNPCFLRFYLLSPQAYRSLTGQMTGTAIKRIILAKIRDTIIPLPPLAEQQQIVALVEERLSQIDSAEKTIDSELIRSKRLRQSILKRAFEGNLVPQDPNDEPASVLLERIKASREQEQPKKKAKKAKAKAK
jgi:type I restriction enzyme S subunit